MALKVVAAGVGTSPGTPVSDEMNEMAKNTHETTVKMLPMLCTFAADGLMRLPPVRGRRPDTSDMMGETAYTVSWLAQTLKANVHPAHSQSRDRTSRGLASKCSVWGYITVQGPGGRGWRASAATSAIFWAKTTFSASVRRPRLFLSCIARIMDCRSCAACRRAALSGGRLVGAGVRDLEGSDAVSYTHLTLPTKA